MIVSSSLRCRTCGMVATASAEAGLLRLLPDEELGRHCEAAAADAMYRHWLKEHAHYTETPVGRAQYLAALRYLPSKDTLDSQN